MINNKGQAILAVAKSFGIFLYKANIRLQWIEVVDTYYLCKQIWDSGVTLRGNSFCADFVVITMFYYVIFHSINKFADKKCLQQMYLAKRYSRKLRHV